MLFRFSNAIYMLFRFSNAIYMLFRFLATSMCVYFVHRGVHAISFLKCGLKNKGGFKNKCGLKNKGGFKNKNWYMYACIDQTRHILFPAGEV